MAAHGWIRRRVQRVSRCIRDDSNCIRSRSSLTNSASSPRHGCLAWRAPHRHQDFSPVIAAGSPRPGYARRRRRGDYRWLRNKRGTQRRRYGDDAVKSVLSPLLPSSAAATARALAAAITPSWPNPSPTTASSSPWLAKYRFNKLDFGRSAAFRACSTSASATTLTRVANRPCLGKGIRVRRQRPAAPRWSSRGMNRKRWPCCSRCSTGSAQYTHWADAASLPFAGVLALLNEKFNLMAIKTARRTWPRCWPDQARIWRPALLPF